MERYFILTIYLKIFKTITLDVGLFTHVRHIRVHTNAKTNKMWHTHNVYPPSKVKQPIKKILITKYQKPCFNYKSNIIVVNYILVTVNMMNLINCCCCYVLSNMFMLYSLPFIKIYTNLSFPPTLSTNQHKLFL